MTLKFSFTNLGIEITTDNDKNCELLKPSPDADQEKPRKYYVYAHVDNSGTVFYVGKGTGRRAWSTDRHELWHRFVDKHLGGCYKVIILHDGLTEERAEELEGNWIYQCSNTIVNWQNFGRDTDFRSLERYNELRNANRDFIAKARKIEKSDLVHATKMYREAIEAISKYVVIRYENGLVGQLMNEELEYLGAFGEIEALDRLTLCLTKLGRVEEAVQVTNEYFKNYRRDLGRRAAERIKKRLGKATARQNPQNTISAEIKHTD